MRSMAILIKEVDEICHDAITRLDSIKNSVNQSTEICILQIKEAQEKLEQLSKQIS